ncbi:MAG: UDP-N-acetylmuramoylalanyl-D-glutamyl-2, 6-diaminopimelate--D-alanyl-D-alanine ligase [Kordiimonadales bacterium]|nr:MAG: UDP-N-acetylmuramoylalanyl-D-glutamyl-2, 6-diaminopimelate--D-alanyl-D-alanine ligase [Kordiimonadales bacterium]
MQIQDPLWTSAELASACDAVTARPWFADGLQTDSRDVLPGDLFIALKGGTTDGHAFVRSALENGAAAAIVCGDVPGVEKDDLRLVRVKDSEAALAAMAFHSRNRAPAKIIGVTGSAGKTTVVQALRQSLENVGTTHASVKSFNNHVGVPLSLARMPRNARYGVFEIGMSAAGEIARGGASVRPDVAVITAVGGAHVGNFPDEKSIVGEKASLFSSICPGGMAVIGIDHDHGLDLIRRASDTGVTAITVSVLEKADVRPIRMTEKHNCTCLTADIFGTLVTYKIAQPGREWVLNSLLVLAAVKAADADLGQAALALAGLEAEPGRGRAHELSLLKGKATLLDDSYNANPLSVRAALRRLSLTQVSENGNRVAVLSDMQDLGSKSEEIHFSLVRDMQQFNVTKIISFGDQMAAVGEAAGVEVLRWNDPTNSAGRLMAELGHGDAVMVKGANSAGLHELVRGMLEISNDETPMAFDTKRSAQFAASGR